MLEFIHGKDIEAVINETNGFLPEHQVMSWAIELCDVLEYLHNHKPDPIIFRDMKPSNVMINSSGDVMLIDFGIAKVFQSGIRGTMIPNPMRSMKTVRKMTRTEGLLIGTVREGTRHSKAGW